jgi:TolA-binding protein
VIKIPGLSKQKIWKPPFFFPTLLPEFHLMFCAIVVVACALSLGAAAPFADKQSDPAQEHVHDHSAPTSGINDDLLVTETAQSDTFWDSQHHDRSEIERAWQKEEQMRRAAEQEHKLNVRLRDSLTENRDTIAQVNTNLFLYMFFTLRICQDIACVPLQLKKQLEDLQTQKLSDHTQLITIQEEAKAKEDRVQSLQTSLNDETRIEVEARAMVKSLQAQVDDMNGTIADLNNQVCLFCFCFFLLLLKKTPHH